MIPLLDYVHRCFIRSYRYGAPSFIYVGILALLYSSGPNPVMGSYAFSSALLFVVAAAIGCLLIDIEAANQEMATMLHARSLVRLSAAKLLYAWIFASLLGVFAVGYPVLLGRLERFPSIEELVMGSLYHISLAGLGVSIAGWVTIKLFESRFYATLLLCTGLALSFGAQGIGNALPEGWAWITYVLPPLQFALQAQTIYDDLTLGAKWLPIGAAVGYSALSVGLFFWALHRRRLDYPGE